MNAPRVLSIFALLLWANPVASDGMPSVGPLVDQRAIDGCAWTARSDEIGTGFVFLGEYGGPKALMNFDGIDVELALVDEKGALVSVGDTLERRFRGPGVAVDATFRATWVCPDHDDACEVTRFEVLIRVAKDGRRQLVRGQGDVGC